MYQRILKLPKTNSFFLFGARGTGKTELLRQSFSEEEALFVDLLDPEITGRLLAYPNEFISIISPHAGRKKWVVLDEVQKVPQLLELVHQQISYNRFHFALTGSSARKLKRGAANLLAGRAFVFNLYPLTAQELGDDFDLISYLSYGGLPGGYHLATELDRRRMLKAYAQTYLKEEILEEQVVRKLPPFRRFLDVVGAHSSEIVNYSNIARDIDSDPKAIMRYYEILEDTLLGFYLPSYNRSIRKQQKQAKRFYFFDPGIVRVLAGRIDIPLVPKTFEYGQLFETFIVNEVQRLLTYEERQFSLSFLRVSDTQEIDLIVEKGNRTFLCEIKSTDRVDERMTKSLVTLEKDFSSPHLRLISNDPIPKQYGNVLALHWRDALKELAE
jgi:predicted AAA+ superfamily ATPase